MALPPRDLIAHLTDLDLTPLHQAEIEASVRIALPRTAPARAAPPSLSGALRRLLQRCGYRCAVTIVVLDIAGLLAGMAWRNTGERLVASNQTWVIDWSSPTAQPGVARGRPDCRRSRCIRGMERSSCATGWPAAVTSRPRLIRTGCLNIASAMSSPRRARQARSILQSAGHCNVSSSSGWAVSRSDRCSETRSDRLKANGPAPLPSSGERHAALEDYLCASLARSCR
jgi:hypothetical protein